MTKKLTIGLNLLKVCAIGASICLLLHTVLISDSIKDTLGHIRLGVKTNAPFTETYTLTSIAEKKMNLMQLEIIVATGLLLALAIIPWKRFKK